MGYYECVSYGAKEKNVETKFWISLKIYKHGRK
jgi:hypothetical protein